MITQPSESSVTEQIPMTRRASILIADDEPRIRLTLRSCLEAEGYDVEEARDGAEAIRAIIDARPDLVLLDLAMPHLDGIAMLRELRVRFPDITPRVIVLTAWGTPVVKEEAFMLGVCDFLKKPIVPSVLRTVVARVFSAKHPPSPADDADEDSPFGHLFLG